MNQKSGIFLINKLPNISSYSQISLLKKMLKIKKVGHAGTLDPLATGLLIVLVNDATKISDFLISDNKEYIASSQFFIKTDTGDIAGQVVENQKPFIFKSSKLNKVFKDFNQLQYTQTVPIYSAVKIKGKKLYEYARNHQQVDLPTRKVLINKIKLINYNQKDNTIDFLVNCSKGTYVRSLVEDIAKKLQSVATIKNLFRTKSGNFTINESKKWNQITWDDLIPLENVVKMLSIPFINYEDTKKLINGQEIYLPGINVKQIFIKSSQVISLYRKKNPNLESDNYYVCQRLIHNIHKI